jgi:cytidylate kinase
MGWLHLDSGALYRALTLAALDNLTEAPGVAGWSASRVLGLADELPVRVVRRGAGFVPEVAGVDVDAALRDERVTAHVSGLAALPAIREWVNAQQRVAVAHHPGVVVDGRDIGTAVFPDARLKVFLTASPAERARRRLVQRGQADDLVTVAREAERLAARDEADATRAVAPLRPAGDAVVLDTTDLSLAAQVERIVTLAHQRGLG